MKHKRFLSILLTAVILLSCFSMLAVGASAAGTWDGKTANVKWYTDHSTETSFTISTAEDFYGFSILVEAAGATTATLKGDGQVYYNADGTVITDADAVNVTSIGVAGTKFKGCTVTLSADIDLGSHPFIPIGATGSFQGLFDGANHTIRNLLINTETSKHKTLSQQYVALFGAVTGSGAGIKNLVIENEKLELEITESTTRAWIGGIVSNSHSGGCTVENCKINGLEIDLKAASGATVEVDVGAISGNHSSKTVQTGNVVTDYKFNNINNYENVKTDASNLFGVATATAGKYESSSVTLKTENTTGSDDTTKNDGTTDTGKNEGTDNPATSDYTLAVVALMITAALCTTIVIRKKAVR